MYINSKSKKTHSITGKALAPVTAEEERIYDQYTDVYNAHVGGLVDSGFLRTIPSNVVIIMNVRRGTVELVACDDVRAIFERCKAADAEMEEWLTISEDKHCVMITRDAYEDNVLFEDVLARMYHAGPQGYSIWKGHSSLHAKNRAQLVVRTITHLS